MLDPATVQRTVLANGLTVLARHDASAPVVAAVTYVKAGYFDETDDVVGIAHVLEHMYFKGTATRGVGEISRQTKSAGGYLNAATIYDHTSYYTVLPAARFASALEVQADAFAGSVIDQVELDRELEVIVQEAHRKADNPSAVSVETLYALLHDRHRMRRWRIGREEGLRRLTRDHVVAFYRNFYRPRNTILALVGDVDTETMLSLAERYYGALPDAPVVRAPGEREAEHDDFRYRELSGDVGQSQVVMGWRTPGATDVDTPLLDLAAAVLGAGRASRLYRAVRETRLAASIAAYNYTPTEVGVFVMHAETPPPTSVAAAQAAWAQLADLRDRGVGAHELARAVRIFEARWIRRLETMEGQATYLAEWEALGSWTLGDRYLEQVMGVTADDVTDAVRRHLGPERAGVVVYRPSDSHPVADGAERMRALLVAGRASLLPPLTPPASAPALSSGSATFERIDAGVHVFRTGSGVPILVRRKAGAPLVHAAVHLLGGAVDESAASAGLTSLVVRTAVKGTEQRSASQIAEEAEMLGGSVGPTLGSESFGWVMSVPTKHTAAMLALLADVVQRPTFPDGALETERAIAIADLALLRDDMFRWPMRLVREVAFAGHSYGVPASGTDETLQRIAADQVRRWHRDRVRSGASVVVIVGDVDPAAVATLAARELADLVPGAGVPIVAPRWPVAGGSRAEIRDKEQTALALAFPAPSRTDDDRWAAQLLAGITSGLGGRFFDELRDRQSLAYTVHASAIEQRSAGMFAAYIATSPEREERARRGLLDEFAKLREHGVTVAELAQAKTYALGTHAIRQQSGAAVLSEVADAWLFGRLDELGAYAEQVQRVTARGIHAVARRYFDESVKVEGVVRGSRGGARA
ncbi:MAG: pitrilysin family protein [Gemmatimonadaceae bacterium]